MDPCPGTRRRNALSWLAVAWFSSAVRAAVGGAVGLQTETREVTSTCGANVTLKCEASVPPQADIKLFSWIFKNQSCRYKDQRAGPWCQSLGEPPRCSLALTLVNVMPADQGTYLCKLHSNVGVNHSQTVVTVRDCFGSSAASVNETHASCCFGGVYPAGVVQWSTEHSSLTEPPVLPSGWEEMDPDGRYNICSAVGVRRRNTSQPLLCSLWSPSRATRLASRKVSLTGGQEPSRRVAAPQGVLVVLGMAGLKLVT